MRLRPFLFIREISLIYGNRVHDLEIGRRSGGSLRRGDQSIETFIAAVIRLVLALHKIERSTSRIGIRGALAFIGARARIIKHRDWSSFHLLLRRNDKAHPGIHLTVVGAKLQSLLELRSEEHT